MTSTTAAAPAAGVLAACVLAAGAGCDGGTVVIANDPGAAPQPAAQPAARQPAPRQPAPRVARTDPPPELRPAPGTRERRRGAAARRSGTDRRTPAFVAAPGDAPDPPAVADTSAFGGPGVGASSGAGLGAGAAGRGSSRFGAAPPMTADEAVAVLSGVPDTFQRADALKALAAAPVDEARRDEVNALLGRTLMAALDGPGTAAAGHIAAMMHWAADPAEFRKIGEAAVLAGGPSAGREVLRRASLLEHENSVHALTPLLRDRWVGRAAVQAVKRLGEQAEPAVLPLLDDGDPAMRRDAATLLSSVGGPDGAEALLKRSKVESDGGLARHMRQARTEVLTRLRASGR